MYANYIKERLGDHLFLRDEGFATYRFTHLNGVKCVYIVDIYVEPDFRKSKIASDMADAIAEIGRKEGCKMMLGSVASVAKGSTESAKVLLAYGMTFLSWTSDAIIFQKEI